MEQMGLLFFAFLQIGLFSIGGGYAIIPAIQEQVVETYHWVSQQTFTDIITISQMTPGPLAVNTSTFVGMQIEGLLGALIATFGCVISGICIGILLDRFFRKHENSTYVFQVLKGLKSASLGLIISAAATIMLLTFLGTSAIETVSLSTFSKFDWKGLIMFLAALVILRKRKTNPILLMTAAGVLGIFLY